MEVYRFKVTYSETYFKPVIQGSYDMFNIGAYKTWHGGPRFSSKVVVNSGRRYTSTYA